MGRRLKIVIACAALLLALAFVGLHVHDGIEAGSGSWASGPFRASTAAATRRVTWREPVPFAAALVTEGAPTRIAFGPRGANAVVAHGERGHDATLWFVEFDGEGGVVRERPLTEIDGPGDELAPWFDGRTLWFSSERAGGPGGFDIWCADFVDGRFEDARVAPGSVNSPADELDPTAHDDELVFVSDRDGGFDLYSADLSSGAVAKLDALSSSEDEREPAFAPDGGSLWFALGSGGDFAIQRAFRAGARWLPRDRVAPLDARGSERAPAPLGNGFEIAFLRDGLPMQSATVELALVPALPWTLAQILLLAALLALAALAWFARDLARYDVLIAAWVGSILIHAAVLLLLGELRSSGGGGADGGGPAPRGTDDVPFQLRTSPASDSRGLARGGTGSLERVEIARGIASGELAASADLAAAIVVAPSTSSAPDRGLVEAGAGVAGPRALADRADDSPPSAAPVAASSTALPGPGRTMRTPSASAGIPERFAVRADAAFASGSTAGSGRALDVEHVESDGPAVARAASAPRVAPSAARDLGSDESTSIPTATAAPAPRSDVLAMLAPAASARGADAPALERFSTGRDRGGSALTAPRTPIVDEAPSEGRASGAEAPPRLAATPYQTRVGPAKERALEAHGGTAETEAAVERGLRYLARIQGRLGTWGPLEHRDEKYGEICVGKTALATLAFLAAGHSHVSATEHSAVVQKALAFLLATQDGASGHFGDTSAYSHGIATFALAEALAITGDVSLRESVERAVAHVLERQSRASDPRKRGGWPYYYIDPEREFDPWPRTSITAWQVMALESARISGVSVPDAAFDEAARFLEGSREPRADYYRYSHEPARLRSGYPTLPASTPAALFALSCIGRDIRGPEQASARAYVLDRAPRGYRFTNERDFVERAQGNPYFWYQATLAMFRVGGTEWKKWNAALQETLLPAQDDDGSWKPIDVYARYAQDNATDRAYTTALCVLCLEVYYRYDLPLLSAGRPAAEPR